MILLVGDVQGCHAALLQLLAASGFSASRDRLVVLGDLVNRGPDSLGVLRTLSALGSSAVSLLGNHDLHLLAVAQGVRELHKGDTFVDVLALPRADRDPLLDWLRHQLLAHEEAGWLCVHAGVVPQWDSRQTLELAAEVHAVLRGAELAAFMPQMYGNQPDAWRATLAGADRWRFIINTLTRIRFCTAEGRLDLKSKEGADTVCGDLLPWFKVPGRRTAGQAIAFGHWSTLGLVNTPELLGLDTGCVWGGALTAVRVDGGRREVFQVPCDQAQKPGD